MTGSFAFPEPIRSGKVDDFVNISALTENEKAVVWKHLTSHHPVIANRIASVRQEHKFQELIEAFEGEILVERKYLPTAMADSIKR